MALLGIASAQPGDQIGEGFLLSGRAERNLSKARSKFLLGFGILVSRSKRLQSRYVDYWNVITQGTTPCAYFPPSAFLRFQ